MSDLTLGNALEFCFPGTNITFFEAYQGRKTREVQKERRSENGKAVC